MNDLTLSGVVLSPTGLTYAEPPTFDQWSADGPRLDAIKEAVSWWRADWALYGESRYGERASQAMELGVAPQTLMNEMWVGARFHPSRRRESLSFAHHAEVAALEPEEADAMLDRAQAEGWSTRQLRAVRNEVKAISNGQRTSLPTCPECGTVLTCPNCGGTLT